MFETFDGTEIEIHPFFEETGRRLWSAITLRLHLPWIYATYGIEDQEGNEFRQMACLSQIDDLLHLAAADYLKIREVNIVLPGHMTGKDAWTMEPLAEIWEGIEPETENQKAHVFITGGGGRYLRSGLCDDESQLREKKRIFQNPCLRMDS